MRLMAASAPFESHDCVFEREGPALIAMALEAAGVITRESFGQRRAPASMRIVAIHATHRPLRQFVVIGFLELRPDVHMTRRAQFVDRGGLPGHKTCWSVGVNFVACNAGDFILHMAALNPGCVLRAARVAGEASPVSQRSRDFCRVPDVAGRYRTRVRSTRTVARFACPALPGGARTLLDRGVRALQEGVINVLMAGLASFRTHVFRCFVLPGHRNTCHQDETGNRESGINIEHAPGLLRRLLQRRGRRCNFPPVRQCSQECAPRPGE